MLATSGYRSITSKISTPRVLAAIIAWMLGIAEIKLTNPVINAITVWITV
jgi:hypothetical protein